jgi:anaerobic C4-dicarboxylate transporter
MARTLIARLIVVILLGIATGYAVGKSLAKDAATGRELTLKQYIADFESHKEKLVSSDMSMGVAIFVGVLMLVVALGVYELLVFAVDKALARMDRRPAEPGGWADGPIGR